MLATENQEIPMGPIRDLIRTIESRRLALRLTQQQLAEASTVSRDTIIRVEAVGAINLKNADLLLETLDRLERERAGKEQGPVGS